MQISMWHFQDLVVVLSRLLPRRTFFYRVILVIRQRWPRQHAHILSQNILAEDGMPSRIRLYIQRQVAPNPGNLAEILLFYDHLGFGVHYFFLNAVTQDPENSATRICLKDDHLESFKLYLQAPDDRTPLEKMVTVAIGNRFFPYDWLQPLADMTTLSIEDFYNRFTSSPIIECFDLG